METAQKRRIAKAISALLDRSHELLVTDPGAPRTLKLEGEGWRSYIYAPSGPGTETIHVEVKIDSFA